MSECQFGGDAPVTTPSGVVYGVHFVYAPRSRVPHLGWTQEIQPELDALSAALGRRLW